jgi:hypothetical protein
MEFGKVVTRGEAGNSLVQKVQGLYRPFILTKQLVSTLSGPYMQTILSKTAVIT